jgi:hypothetical protein
MAAKYSTRPLFDRLEEKAERVPIGGCWIWMGATSQKGYGVLSIRARPRFAHRLMWTAVHGAIPAGMSVCHRCDNPPCVNPAHLFIGTAAHNSTDMLRKGRQRRPSKIAGAKRAEAESLLLSGMSAVAVAARFGVSRNTVMRAVGGVRVLRRALSIGATRYLESRR